MSPSCNWTKPNSNKGGCILYTECTQVHYNKTVCVSIYIYIYIYSHSYKEFLDYNPQQRGAREHKKENQDKENK
jgi:hypothetical protein